MLFGYLVLMFRKRLISYLGLVYWSFNEIYVFMLNVLVIRFFNFMKVVYSTNTFYRFLWLFFNLLSYFLRNREIKNHKIAIYNDIIQLFERSFKKIIDIND